MISILFYTIYQATVCVICLYFGITTTIHDLDQRRQYEWNWSLYFYQKYKESTAMILADFNKILQIKGSKSYELQNFRNQYWYDNDLQDIFNECIVANLKMIEEQIHE